jgi:hypothetical protein
MRWPGRKSLYEIWKLKLPARIDTRTRRLMAMLPPAPIVAESYQARLDNSHKRQETSNQFLKVYRRNGQQKPCFSQTTI